MLSIDTPLGSIAANRIEGGCHKQQQNINYALETLNFPRFSERQILVGDAGGLVLQKFTYTCMEITSLWQIIQASLNDLFALHLTI